jgi:hypothetical protein
VIGNPVAELYGSSLRDDLPNVIRRKSVDRAGIEPATHGFSVHFGTCRRLSANVQSAFFTAFLGCLSVRHCPGFPPMSFALATLWLHCGNAKSTATPNRRGSSKMPDLPAPFPLAIVIADAVHIDPSNGKAFILGTFSVIHATGFPAAHQFMAVFISLTGGRGIVPIRATIIRTGEEEEIIAQTDGEVEFSDPRVIVDLMLGLEGIVFPAPGEYRVQLYAAGEFMTERRLVVVDPKSESEQ